jgi:hypothetical protein
MRCPFRFRRLPEAVLKCMSGTAWIQVPTICTAWKDSAHRAVQAGSMAGPSGDFSIVASTPTLRGAVPATVSRLCANAIRAIL